MSDIDLDAPKHIFLMIYMLIDRKKPDSFFKPYYDILPPTLHNMPIFWGPEELKYLEGSYLLQQIDERNAAIESDYLSICSLAPSFRNVCNLEEFKWARMCVCSRNFGLIVNGVRTAALVPYADMLNHYRPRETKWQFEDSSQSFTITTLQSIVAGAQVYDSYGQKCNHRFLLNYGFSVERNVEPDGSCPNEVCSYIRVCLLSFILTTVHLLMQVPILLELKKDDPLYEQKMTFWRRDSASSARRLRIAVCDNENSRNMMALLRVIESDRNEFEKLISSGESNSGYRSIRNAHVPVSTRLEFKVLIKLNELISQYLAAYPTTYDDDCKRLESPDGPVLFSNERHALIQVKGEKEILLFYKEFTETGIRLLQIKDNNWIEYDAIMNQVRNSKHSIVYQYCRNVIHRLRCDEQRRNEIRQKSVDFSRPTIV
jgi:histone-lysine N-methyltransferase SETD3